jgi:hypothetical protein
VKNILVMQFVWGRIINPDKIQDISAQQDVLNPDALAIMILDIIF